MDRAMHRNRLLRRHMRPDTQYVLELGGGHTRLVFRDGR